VNLGAADLQLKATKLRVQFGGLYQLGSHS
jgi:hypothetical protein